ncbi:MAG: SDR family oxidoreductase [Bacteroidia bacterium]
MKTAIITGASSGIGKACAIHFAKNGFAVVLAARDLMKLQELKSTIEAMGGKAMVVKTDVANENSCREMIENTVNEFGSIDVLINNAGISMRALFAELELDVLRQVMDINFWGTVYCSKYALPYLLKTKGSLVGVSSIAGKKGLPGRSGYSASKFAMEGLLECIRTENLKTGLHVLVACPGFTASAIRERALNDKGMQQGESPRKEGDMMQPEEVAAHIYNAVIARKRDLVLTSQGKLTVFLNKFFPQWLDKKIYELMAKERDSPVR